MDILAAGLYCLASAGAIAMGCKYALGTAPLDYHRKILAGDNGTVSAQMTMVLTGLYTFAGWAAIGLGITLMVISVTWVAAGSLLASLLVLVAGVLGTAPAVKVAHGMEKETGIRTPWRSGVPILVLIVAGFVASMV